MEPTTARRWHEICREPCEAAANPPGAQAGAHGREMEAHPARPERERRQRGGEAMDVFDPEPDDPAAPAARERRFEFTRDLLTAPALGRS